jgi:hypothetical protein
LKPDPVGATGLDLQGGSNLSNALLNEQRERKRENQERMTKEAVMVFHGIPIAKRVRRRRNAEAFRATRLK